MSIIRTFPLLAAAFGLPALALAQVTNPADLTWYKFRTLDTITPGVTSVLFTEGQTSGSSFLANFTAASLLPGETVTINLVFTTGATLSTSSNSFRFALLNNGGTPMAANQNGNTNNLFLDDTGFLGAYNFSGSSSALYADNDLTTNALASGLTGWTSVSSSPTGTNAAFAASTQYTFILSATNTGSGYSLSTSMNGGAIVNYARSGTTAIAGLPTSLNAFVFYVNGGSNTVSSIQIDGMTVTSVPEPSAWAMLAGVAALGLALVRRLR